MAYDQLNTRMNNSYIRNKIYGHFLGRGKSKEDLYRRWMFGDKPYWLICDLALEIDIPFMDAVDAWEDIGRIINRGQRT